MKKHHSEPQIAAKLGGSFIWLNTTQFLGALNDNIFKVLIVLFLISQKGTAAASSTSAIALAVFVVPFLIFTAFAGNLADRLSKRNIIVITKAAELLVMLVGIVAFRLNAQIILYGVLFLMATQSAFFGPAKYSIIPELVLREQISRANSFLTAMTYLAIVIGIPAVPLIAYITGGGYEIVGLICVCIAATGFLASLQIEPTPAAGGKKEASLIFVRDIVRTLSSIRRRKELTLAIYASAYFFMVAAFIHINVIPYGIHRLGLDERQSAYLFLIAAIGIGTGAIWAGKLSGRNIEFGIVPLGALGLTISSVGLGLLPGGIYLVIAMLFLMGVSAGLFIVPINAFMQFASPKRRRGQVLAASGFLSWTGVLLASGLIYVFSELLKLSPSMVFVLQGAMTLALAIVTVILLPDFLFRFFCVMLTKLCYRITVRGTDNVPVEGGVLLVSNHASWVDALLLGATQQRRIRFIMERDFYNIWWLKPICKLMGAIPISASDPPKKIVTALKHARTAMDEGYMVCIFAEGAMTRTGMLLSFKTGFEKIMKQSSYKIIPVYLGGVWGSIFSYYYGKPLSTLPKKFPYPVSVHFGQPMPGESSASQIRQKVTELSCDYFDSLRSSHRSLSEHFVRVARKNWRKRCISDSTGKQLNYGKTLISTIALSAELDKLTEGQDKIGILLPPSAAGALANLAVTMLGKASVNLNYVTSRQAREEAIKQCGIKSIISSRKFIEKFETLTNLQGMIFLEDILKKLAPSAKLKAYLKARFTPIYFLTKHRPLSADSLATVIFTSGSSGQPKGVMLSHHNILSNIEALRMVFKLKPDDNLCAVLPFFHAFGFTCTLWLPLVSGVSASYVANPLDGKTSGKTARENRSTLLFGTPTFLLNYVRKAEREDFANLRYVVVGAAKLKESVADSFEAKFGIRPVEGYGATELSPVVSLNLSDVNIGGVSQVGNKPGAVGHPIPGVAIKIVDIDTNEPLPVGQSGLLMVKGPNLMLGYLNMEKETEKVIKDRWYNTGDVAKTDEDGFITLTDRLSRFSKIAGEMVPHMAIEETYLNALDTDQQVLVVTSVPDNKKGEELVVLYLHETTNADKLHDIITNSNIPNIWKPKRSNYIKIDSMPLLGSGKLDIKKLRKIALAERKGTNGIVNL